MALRKSAPLFLPSSFPRVTVSLERLTIRVGVGIADVVDVPGADETGGLIDSPEMVVVVGSVAVEPSLPPDPVAPEPSPKAATRL